MRYLIAIVIIRNSLERCGEQKKKTVERSIPKFIKNIDWYSHNQRKKSSVKKVKHTIKVFLNINLTLKISCLKKYGIARNYMRLFSVTSRHVAIINTR